MSQYMRAFVTSWADLPFEELVAFMHEHSDFEVRAAGGRGWLEFEAVNAEGQTVLSADLSRGDDVREEAEELDELLEDLAGAPAAREQVRAHLATADAVLGLQILASVHEQAVDAANAIFGFLEQRPGVLVQVDGVGWYDGADLILNEDA